MVRGNRRREMTEEERSTLRNQYFKSKKELRIAINVSKRKAWEKLCDDLNRNIWGSAYKIVCKKFKVSPNIPLKIEEKIKEAEKLFPRHEPITWEEIEVRAEEIPKITMEEVVEAFHKLKNKKAPGTDGISSEIAKALFEADPQYCTTLFNNILVEGTFPKIWKIGKLVLLEKGKTDDEGKMTYRPICLLNVLGKVMEHLIKGRLVKELKEKGDLCEAQFGFREGRSTLDAMGAVLKLAEEAKHMRKLCAMTLVDIKNAFNSMPWKGIIRELKKKNISNYLVKILCSYFQDRRLEIEDDVIQELTSGVPQGSVLGTILWNVYYDPVLKTELPPNSSLVAYADDLVIVTSGKTKEEIEQVTNNAMEKIIEWMNNAQLKVAPQKTEVVLLASKRKCREITVRVEDMEIKSKKSAKYLGVMFDENLRMVEHVKYAVEKAERTAGMLAKIMPNLKGPDNSKRKILASVVYSTLLYGASVWGKIIRWQKYITLLQRVQRKVMTRLCRSYRTTSTPALQVLSGSLPIELMIEEKMGLYNLYKRTEDVEERRDGKTELQEELMIKWQQKWDREYAKGQWTKRLIPNINVWISRTHGDLTYELSQFFTGHGHFNTYLFKIKKRTSEKCQYCNSERDDPYHTLYECTRFVRQRYECNQKLGKQLTPEITVEEMVKSKEGWETIEKTIRDIMKIKEKDGRTL
ncbi:hypothetical protein M8J77_023050 [Diaphorina citri]|nr:hypothetical protein M8J77_023050 [Diaphorina citri]